MKLSYDLRKTIIGYQITVLDGTEPILTDTYQTLDETLEKISKLRAAGVLAYSLFNQEG
jgi:hypothetical protein